jgi:hypothetical protein
MLLGEKNHTMFYFDFEYHSPILNETMTAKTAQDDEFIFVTVGDTSLGAMVEDSNSPYGYTTEDPLLQRELEHFTMAYKEALAIDNLPSALHQLFGQNLTGWAWTGDKDLKLIAHPDMDLVEFAGVIRDQINEVVLFDKPLTIYLSKEGSGDVEEIFIN